MAVTQANPRGQKTRRNDALVVRMGPVWEKWLDRFCGHTRRQKSNLVEEALAAYAERLSFEPPPPRV